MQNTNKKRLVSASVAAAIAVSQFSPLAAFATDVAPETVYVAPESKTDESEAPNEVAVTDTSANTSPEVSTEDTTSAVPESTAEEMSEEASTDVKEPAEEDGNISENISPDTDSTMQSAESKNEGLVTDNAAETQAPDNKAETVSAANAEKVRVTITAGAVINGVATADATREYGCANPVLAPVIKGLTEEDEAALANGSKTIEGILGFTPNLSTNALESSAPGDYTITVTNAPATYGNYEIAVLPGTLHVTRRKVTVTVNENQGKVYGDNSHESYHYRAAWSDGSYVKDPNIPLSPNGSRLQKIACVITRDPGEDAGTYVMHPAPVDEAANRFYDITLVDGTYTISKAPLTIRTEPGSSVYGELPRDINISGVDGFQRGDNWDSVFGANVKPVFSAQGKNTALDGMTEARAPIGEYMVTGVMPVEAKNYDVTIQPTTLNITPRPVTLSIARGQHKIYGETDPELRVNFGGLGVVAGDFANCKVGRAAGEDVGFYQYNINEFLDSTDARNYTISLDAESLNGTNRFEIVKREVRADIDSVTKVYGENFDPAKFSVSLTGFANEADEKAFRDSISFVCAGTGAAANAKDYVIAATYAENPNFNVVLHNGTMTVQKRPISLSFHNSQKEYGQKDPSDMLSYDVHGNITENGMDTLQLETGHLTGTTLRNEGEDVGSYDVFTTLSNDNYTITYKNGETAVGVADGTKKNVGNLHINAADLKVTVDAIKPITYGDPLPEFTVSFDGFQFNENAETALTGTLEFYDKATGVALPERPAAGEYQIAARGLVNAGAENYNIIFEDALLTVKPREITVKPNAASKVYGEQDPEFTYTITPANTNELTVVKDGVDLLNLTVVREAGESAGRYAMRVEGNDPNFIIFQEPEDFVITAKPLTISLKNDQTRVYGDENPVLTVDDLNVSGYVNDDALNIHDDIGSLDVSGLEFHFVDAEGKTATVKSHACKDGEFGKVVISGVTNIGKENYDIHFEDAKFTITKRPIAISTKKNENGETVFQSVYGDAPNYDWADYNSLNDIVYSNDDGKPALVNGDKLMGQNNCLVNEKSAAGTYQYAVIPDFEHPDYDITKTAGEYIIHKRPLTWNIRDFASTYGEKLTENSLQNSLFRNDGGKDVRTIVNGDSLNAVITVNGSKIVMNGGDDAKTFTCDVNELNKVIGNAGKYTLLGEAQNSNYDISIVYNDGDENAEYTVAERVVTITVTEPEDFVYGDQENPVFKLDAVVNEELAETPIIDGDDIGLTMPIRFTAFDAEEPNDVADAFGQSSDIIEDLFTSSITFQTKDIRNAGVYEYVLDVDDSKLPGSNYAIAVKYEKADGTPADRRIVVSRRDLKVEMPSAERLYGVVNDTLRPELEFSNFAFEDTKDVLPKEITDIMTTELDAKFMNGQGTPGVYEDAFTRKGFVFGNYNIPEAKSALEIKRLPINEDVTVMGSLADENGKPVAATPEDQFKDSWSISNVRMVAPRGYKISCSDALDDFNLWSDSLIVATPGKDVQVKYFLRNEENGAITEMGSKTVNIDKKAPELSSVEVAEENDIKNGKFSEYDREINIKVVGRETDTTQDVWENMIMPLFVDEASSAVAPYTTNSNPNSGIATVEYYTLNKSDAQFDAAGDLIIDNSKFKQIELTYTDPNNAYGSIKVSPDFVGYIVTRTKDISGQYSAAAIATVSVIAPKAAPSAPIRNNSKTGVGPIGIAATAIVLGSAVVALVVIEKKSKKKKGE